MNLPETIFNDLEAVLFEDVPSGYCAWKIEGCACAVIVMRDEGEGVWCYSIMIYDEDEMMNEIR